MSSDFGAQRRKSFESSDDSALEANAVASTDPEPAPAVPSITIGGVTVALKWISLIILIAQNTALVLLMRYSRTSTGPGEVKYLTSTAVVTSEFVKLCISLVAMSQSEEFKQVPGGWTAVVIEELRHKDTIKLAVPGLLYTIQNNLLFIALSNLPAAVYQVTYQLKIITTAIMSVVLLGRSLNKYQIVSLGLLTAGVAVVQVANSSGNSANANLSSDQSAVIGLSCVLLACVTSGFAGVYMEKVLKTGRPVSLFMRNVQLGIFGILLGTFGVFASDLNKVLENGFFQGYNKIVFFVVMLQAGGGLMIAVVMKYADNILKGFATSISIVLSTWLSAILFGFHVSFMFAFGAFVVMCAVFLYGYKPKPITNYLPVSQS